MYPWLSYDEIKSYAVCFRCRQFLKDDSFVFQNWKKKERLSKHSRSKAHELAMTRWLMTEANKKRDTSLLHQLDSNHQNAVRRNREYIKVIIETLIFTAQQNIAQRGHVENRTNIGDVSDVNRGNF